MKHAEPVDPYLMLLRRRLRGRLRYARGPLDPAALANVALLLLLVFVYCGSWVVRQPGIRINLPEMARADALPYSLPVLMITRESLLFLDDHRVTLEELGPALQRAAARSSGQALLVEADEFVQSATLMRVVDLARRAGLRDIRLAGRLPAAAERGAP